MSRRLRIATGFDVHHLRRGVPLMLGTIRIPSEYGLVSNTDGDVVTHALIDALLAAAGAPDIGTCFPSADESSRGRPSIEMLQAARSRHLSTGFNLIHTDITILAEQPPLAPHYESIRRALANSLNTAPDSISIKARSLEGLGPIGSGKAIAAFVTVLAELAEANNREKDDYPLLGPGFADDLALYGDPPEGSYMAFADGGSRGNPGPSACACVVLAPDASEVTRAARFLGESTNNQAEYMGVLLALREMEQLDMHEQPIVLHLDSSLVFHQIIGKYRAKQPALRKLLQQFHTQNSRFRDLHLKLIPRRGNAAADHLVNQTLDQNTE